MKKILNVINHRTICWLLELKLVPRLRNVWKYNPAKLIPLKYVQSLSFKYGFYSDDDEDMDRFRSAAVTFDSIAQKSAIVEHRSKFHDDFSFHWLSSCGTHWVTVGRFSRNSSHNLLRNTAQKIFSGQYIYKVNQISKSDCSTF